MSQLRAVNNARDGLECRGSDYRGDGGTRPPQHFGWGDANVNVPPLIAHLVILLTFVWCLQAKFSWK